MNKLSKSIILGTALVATLATSVEFASARDRYPYWRHNGHNFHNRAVAAGVLGLAAGVAVGAVLSQPRVVYRERPVVVEEAPVYADPDVTYVEPEAEYVGRVDEYRDEDQVYVRRHHEQPAYDDMDDQAQDDNYFPDRPQKLRHNQTVAQGTLEPWTAKWRTYCKQRYQSFNATDGTYVGYDGKSHFCTAG